MAQIKIATLEDLDRLGRILSESLQEYNLPPVFLAGELGAGKTALVKAIVKNLPGSEDAEVSSPSFNIYNLYPTNPPVFHCDLYRCGQELPDDLIAALENGEDQVVLEWAEFFPCEKYPENFLDISFNLIDNERLLNFTAHGSQAQALLACLLCQWEPIKPFPASITESNS